MAEDNNVEPEQTDPDPKGTDLPGNTDPEASGSSAVPAQPVSKADLKGLTPGQRLAAKKAQKASDKREFKQELQRKEEEVRAKEQAEAERIFAQPREPALPDDVQKAAGDFTHFVQNNRGRILGVVGLLLVGSLAFIGIRSYMQGGSSEQAALLEHAIEVQNATIDADDSDGKDENGKPVFKTRAERASKAAEAFAAVVKDGPDALVAQWARLGQASVELSRGQPAKSEPLFQAVYQAAKGKPELEARAVEGLALAAEAQNKPADAEKRYGELKALDKDLGEYHLARLKLEQGEREAAKTLLKGLYDRLSDRSEGAPPSRFLKGEVEARLAEIDSSLVDKGTSGSDGQQFSPEELQRLIEQLQQKGSLPNGLGGE